MATIPRSSRLTGNVIQRPLSDFDAGINTSHAWTDHLEESAEDTTPTPSVSKARSKKYLSESNAVRSMSDDELDEDAEDVTVPAQALYAFQGKAEFRELTTEAGDGLDIIKQDVGEGWSLVRDSQGQIGLLPQTYYTVCYIFTLRQGRRKLTLEPASSHDCQLDLKKQNVAESESFSTPRATLHPTRSQLSLPSIMPQHTGEWLTFPQSLLGGKSLNRFSSFVTSGAEAFLLNGSPTPDQALSGIVASSGLTHSREDTTAPQFEIDEEHNKMNLLGHGEADRHFIETGPAGPVWRTKNPTFSVLVHSPSKRTSPLSAPYTMYSITSIFSAPNSEKTSDWVEVPNPDDCPSPSSTSTAGPMGGTVTRMTVQRRFSHFVILHTLLSRRLPGIALPPLPEKQYAGRFSSDFIEARRGDLERYLDKIVRHPILRYAEILTVFLSCENEDVSSYQ